MEVIFMSRTKLMLLGLLAAFAVSAVASASAMAVVPSWYVCKKGDGTLGSLCLSGTSGEYGWLLLPLLERLTVHSALASGNAVLKSTAAGNPIKIECSTLKGEGWIENPTGAAGKDLEKAEFTGCSLTEPTGQGCTIKEPIVVETETELINETEDKFKPLPSHEFTSIELKSCHTTALNGLHVVNGTAIGILSNTMSEVEFTKASTESTLTFGGEPASFKAKVLVLTDENTGIKAELMS
jgi:hypothetical protein